MCGMAQSSDPEDRPQVDLELLKFQLERSRYRAEIAKWIIVAIGAAISFAVIDYGKLQLERFRATADSQRQLLEAYLKATESPEPDVWKRKLHVLQNFALDAQTRSWASAELDYIDRFAAQDALYRETLRIASQLIEPRRLADPERAKARARFEQLYWADLPYVGESPEVLSAMVGFREKLLLAESAPKDPTAWKELNSALVSLSEALRNSTPKYPSPPG
jgi:hypothetical protein